MTAAHNSRRVARRALQRERAGHVLRRSGRMLVWASALAMAGGVPVSVWGGGEAGLWVVGSLLAGGLVGGAAMALARPRRLVSAAAHVDEALGLEDRLSSALELESTAHTEDPAFSQLAVRDAERRAAEVRVAQAVPVRLTRDWMLWPVLSAAAVAGVLLIPPLMRQTGQPSPGEIARARDSIVRASQAMEEQLRPGEGTGEAADDATFARLADIERELAGGRTTPERARTESAAALEDRARQLDEAARREAEELTRGLRQLDPDPDSSVTDLADALRRSDFAGASERLRELARAAQMMDDASREALAEDLRALAQQIREAEQRQLMADRQEAGPAEPGESSVAEPSLPSESPVEQPDEPEATQTGAPEPEPEQPAGESSDREESGPGSPEETARDSGDQGTRGDEKRTPGEELSDRLNRVAEQIERDPQSLQPDQPAPGEDGESDPRRSQEQREPSSRPEQQGEQPRDGEQGAPTERPSPGQKPAREGEDQADPSKDATPRPRPGEQAPPGDEGQQPDQKSDQSGQSSEQGEEEQPTQRPGQQAPGVQPAPQSGQQGDPEAEKQPSGGQLPGERPSDPSQPAEPESAEPGTEPGDEQSNQQQGQGGSLSEMLDQLEKMDQRKLDALKKVARSEKLREAAQELLDNASPEDLERLRSLAGRFGREPLFDESPPTGDWKPQTEFFDARGQGMEESVPSRVVGAAEGAGAAPGRSIAGVSRAEVAERLRDAAAGAERAIEGQSIPPRMRNYVRSVYRRFEESAARPPVQEGRDADAPSSD